jgi:anti-sigma-K factor RskA
VTHEELQGQYELYAIGVAEEPEREEIRAHLARGCEVCMSEMRRAKQITAMLGTSAPAAAPSAKLRKRILASAGFEEQRGYGLAPWLGTLAALCLVAAFYFASRERGYMEQMVNLRAQMRQQTIELTRLTEIMTIMNGPNTREVGFGAGPKGKVFVNPSSGVVMMATNLPPAPAGKAYEMWIIPKGANPVPAGMFQSGPDGAATHVWNGPVDIAALGAVAVTLEDAAGAAQPTSTPLIVAAMPPQ